MIQILSHISFLCASFGNVLNFIQPKSENPFVLNLIQGQKMLRHEWLIKIIENGRIFISFVSK